MNNRLLALKILHTTVWVALVAMIGYILFSGLANRITPFTYISVGAVIVEGFVLLLFRWRCPITLVARRYSATQEDGFDLFVPRFIARHNKTIFTILYLLAVLLVLFRLANSPR